MTVQDCIVSFSLHKNLLYSFILENLANSSSIANVHWSVNCFQTMVKIQHKYLSNFCDVNLGDVCAVDSFPFTLIVHLYYVFMFKILKSNLAFSNIFAQVRPFFKYVHNKTIGIYYTTSLKSRLLGNF